jgi:3-oxoacyl-[acyl-carrier-protein] synthase-3
MPGFIVGTGRCLPERVVANSELDELLGTDSAWILKNTGIKARRWVSDSEATSDLAAVAAGLALQRAQLPLEAIDYLIAGTMTPDHQIPGIGPQIQTRLGLNHIPCLDIRTACCNPLYAFDVGTALIHAGRAAHVLIVGAEVQSKGLRLAPEAREISALFGDGAGACVISKLPRPGAVQLVDVSLFTDGKFARDLAVLAPGTGNGSCWYDDAPQYRDLFYPVMNGKTVILHAARKLGDAARSLLLRHGWSPQDLDLVIPHQANANLLLALGRQLDIPTSNIISVIEWCGNTSSASMLIALDWAYEQQRISSGRRILFLAFGAGFGWGAALGNVA